MSRLKTKVLRLMKSGHNVRPILRSLGTSGCRPEHIIYQKDRSMKYIFVILSVILSLVSVGCVEYEEASYVKYSLTRSWETGDPHDVERCIKDIVK